MARVHRISVRAFDTENTMLLISTNMFFIVSHSISGASRLLKILGEMEETGEWGCQGLH